MVPALADVRAVRFLADGVQPEILKQALEPDIIGRARRPHFQPLGLWIARADELQGRFNGHVRLLSRIDKTGRKTRLRASHVGWQARCGGITWQPDDWRLPGWGTTPSFSERLVASASCSIPGWWEIPPVPIR